RGRQPRVHLSRCRIIDTIHAVTCVNQIIDRTQETLSFPSTPFKLISRTGLISPGQIVFINQPCQSFEFLLNFLDCDLRSLSISSAHLLSELLPHILTSFPKVEELRVHFVEPAKGVSEFFNSFTAVI